MFVKKLLLASLIKATKHLFHDDILLTSIKKIRINLHNFLLTLLYKPVIGTGNERNNLDAHS